MKKIVFASLFFAGFISGVKAQDFLPEFKAENIGKGRVRITWENPHGNNCIQINIQRSYDSVKNFMTIFSPISPELPQNGFVDAEGGSLRAYYRIFYVLEQGSYFFTKAKRPSIGYDATNINNADADPDIMMTIMQSDSVIARLKFFDYKRFRDSILYNTHDTLFAQSPEVILLKKFDSSGIWIPSGYVFTNREGYINIKLADATRKKYRLVVFESTGKKLFTINHITDPDLVLDKTNFMHAGWYNFELYEDDKLKEKNKFYLPKEF